MTKRRKTGGRDWKKGQSGNPEGRPRLPDDVRIVRQLTATEYVRLVQRYFYASNAELDAVMQHPETPQIDQMVISLIRKVNREGDDRALETLLSRVIGKVKEPPQEVHLNLSMMPRHQVIELGREAVRFLEARQRGGESDGE